MALAEVVGERLVGMSTIGDGRGTPASPTRSEWSWVKIQRPGGHGRTGATSAGGRISR